MKDIKRVQECFVAKLNCVSCQSRPDLCFAEKSLSTQKRRVGTKENLANCLTKVGGAAAGGKKPCNLDSQGVGKKTDVDTILRLL